MNRVQIIDGMRAKMRMMHRSLQTERAYIAWVQKYITFLVGLPDGIPSEEKFEKYMTHLAVKGRVAASTQNQAFNALLFMYRHVLKVDIKGVEGKRARRDKYMPAVMTQAEVSAVIGKMQGTNQLIASLLYGCGLRLKEALRLRVKDVDFGQMSIAVRNTKGHEDRIVMLPESLVDELQEQVEKAERTHTKDLLNGYGSVKCHMRWRRNIPAMLIP